MLALVVSAAICQGAAAALFTEEAELFISDQGINLLLNFSD